MLFSFSIVSAHEVKLFENNLSWSTPSGEEISRLQQFLTDQGYYSGPITGNFLFLTRDAVKLFQLKNGIEPTNGYVGPLTREKINSILQSHNHSASTDTGVTSSNFAAVVSADMTVLQEKISALLAEISALQSQIEILRTQQVGKRVKTTSNVNVRQTASSRGTIVGRQSSGAAGTILAGPINQNSYTWWNVNYDSGVDGWTADANLVINTEINPTPSPVTPPTPLPTPTPVPPTTPLPSPVPPPTPTPVPPTTPTPTPTPTMPMPSPSGTIIDGHPVAASYGIWIPNTKFDTCPSYPSGVTSDADKIAYIQSIHNSYKVLGPDGKWYPTWHPAVDPTTGCKFGHEHGRDPKGSQLWTSKLIQKTYYFDANGNGVMDSSEEAVSGIPFGYANEQLDVYNASRGQMWMRHEDHVGHKVEYANGEADIATDRNNSSSTGGVWIQQNSPRIDTGVRCYFFTKVHQGVSTADAFTNNIHEVLSLGECNAPNPAQSMTWAVSVMGVFGKVGQFTSFMPMCGIERRSQAQDAVVIGTNTNNINFPSSTLSNGDREIITRQCIETGFLVPNGQWSGNLYEAWPVNPSIVSSNGTELLNGLSLLFDVEDSNRYYYPEDLKTLRGYNNPEAGLNRGMTMDLCYDTSLSSIGRVYRGGPCDWATNYGAIKGITWDDPRSAFKGIHRGMYFQSPYINNANGPQYWYTDPFGKNGSQTPFTGSIRQQITNKTINYSSLLPANNYISPRVNDRFFDDANRTVHAPN